MSDQRFSMEPLDGRLMLAAGLAADTAAPVYVRANLNQGIPKRNKLYVEFTVTYKDNVQMDPKSIDDKDIVITGPRRFSVPATQAKVISSDLGGRRIKARYRIDVRNPKFLTAVSGTYSISLKRNQVKDEAGNAVAPKKYSIDVKVEKIREFIKSFLR